MSASEWVEKLKGGKAFPLDVVSLALEIEDAGWDLLKVEDRLVLRPKSQNATKAQQNARGPEPLSEAQKSNIKRLKDHLLDIALYCDNTPVGVV